MFTVEYMGIPIEELEDKLEFTDIVKLCRIGQKAVQGKQDNPYFYFWNTIENRIVFRRIINAMDLSLITPMEGLISQFTSMFLDPSEEYGDLFKKPNASSILPLFYMELGQVHFIRGNFEDAYRIFMKIKSSVTPDFVEQEKLETLCHVAGQISSKKMDPTNFYQITERFIANGDFGDEFFNVIIDDCFYGENSSLKSIKFDARIPRNVKQDLCCLDSLKEAVRCGSGTKLCVFEYGLLNEVVRRIQQRSPGDNEKCAKIDRIFEEYKALVTFRHEEEDVSLGPPESKAQKMSTEEAKILEVFGESFDEVEDEEFWKSFFEEARKKSSESVCSVLENLVHLRMVLSKFYDNEAVSKLQGEDENPQNVVLRYKEFDKVHNIKRSFTTTVHRMVMLYGQSRDLFYGVLKSFRTFDFLWLLSSLTFGSLYKLSKRRTSRRIWISEVGTFERYDYMLCKIMDVLIPEKVKDAKPIAEFFSILVHFQWDNFESMHNVSLAYAIGDAHFFNHLFENVHESTNPEEKLESEARTSLRWYFMGACFETDSFSLFKCSIFKLCLLNVIHCLQFIDKKRGGQAVKLLALLQLLPPGVDFGEEIALEGRRDFGLQNDVRYLQLFWDMPTLEKLSRK